MGIMKVILKWFVMLVLLPRAFTQFILGSRNVGLRGYSMNALCALVLACLAGRFWGLRGFGLVLAWGMWGILLRCIEECSSKAGAV